MLMKKLITLLLVLTGMVLTASADDVTYTVAGDAELVGSNWSETDTDNDMTKVSKGSIYVLKKTGVSLTKGNKQFKVVKDHGWGTSWPTSNYDLYIETAGTYDVIFTFNPANEYVGAFTSMTVAGDNDLIGSNWNVSDTDNDMTFNDDYGFFTLAKTKAYTAGTFEFKVVKDHRWDNGSWPAANYSLKISTAGTYTIYFNYYPGDNSVLAAEAVTTNASGYCTYVNYNPVNITTATAYYATDNDNGSATAHAITNPTGSTPMIIKGDASTMFYFQIYESGTSYSPNAFKAGPYANIPATVDGKYNYILNGDALKAPNGTQNVGTGKAYLQLSAAASARPLIFEDEDVTAINAVTTVNSENKTYFNIAGQRVAQPTKGLYIVNGKKVIMK